MNIIASVLNQFVSQIRRLSYLKRIGVSLIIVSFFFLPLFIWLITSAVLIYFIFLRNRKSVAVEPELDILGNARWARYDDLLLGKGTVNNPDPSVLSLNLDARSIILLGKITVPPRKRKDPVTEDYVVGTEEGHVLTIAQTGAGKGVNVVIPNVLAYEHSVVVLDPKGENFIKTHYMRENVREQEICLVDPFGEVPKEIRSIINQLSGIHSYSTDEAVRYFEQLYVKTTSYGQYLKGFNPLQVIEDLLGKNEYDQIQDEANMIADMIVVTSPNDKDAHWNDKARSYIRGLILILTFAPICQKNRVKYPLNLGSILTLMNEIFTGPPETLQNVIQMCSLDPKLRSVANTFGLIADQERSSVLSVALRHLDFLNSNNVNESLTRNDFQLDDIRTHPKTIYLVLPANKIKSYNQLARLWISSIKSSLERINDGLRRERPVLFMLDEVAQLGRMEPLLNAISLSRGYGLKLWMIFQDVAQMKSAYPNDEWRTFFANTKAQQFFGISPTDIDTCEFVSKAAGQTTVSFITESYSDSHNTGSSTGTNYSGENQGSNYGSSSGRSQSYSINQQIQGRALILPNEVPQITSDNILVFGVSKFPVKAEKMPYYQTPIFEKRFPLQVESNIRERLLL